MCGVLSLLCSLAACLLSLVACLLSWSATLHDSCGVPCHGRDDVVRRCARRCDRMPCDGVRSTASCLVLHPSCLVLHVPYLVLHPSCSIPCYRLPHHTAYSIFFHTFYRISSLACRLLPISHQSVWCVRSMKLILCAILCRSLCLSQSLSLLVSRVTRVFVSRVVESQACACVFASASFV